MSGGDFVVETGRSIERLTRDRRRRQLRVAAGGALGFVVTMYWCGGLGFVVLVGAVAALFYLEVTGQRLEQALEAVDPGDSRVFFTSPRDGLVFANPEGMFLEPLRSLLPYRNASREVTLVRYAGDTHVLWVQLARRDGRAQAVEIQMPRAMKAPEAERVAAQIAGWVSAAKG